MSDFDTWLAEKVKNGYCTPQFCSVHDETPATQTEIEQWDEGLDPCIHVVRLGQPKDWLQ